MKVSSGKLPIRPLLPPRSQKIAPSKIIATGTGIVMRKKGAPPHAVSNNDPKDPLVAKKIIDSLDLGLINFDQRERDTIARILMDKARQIKNKK